MKSLKLFLFVVLLGQSIFAHSESSNCEQKRCSISLGCNLGSSGFTTMNPDNWYSIDTQPYPITVPLSLNRNNGFAQGDIELTSSGVRILKSGNYWVSYTGILFNPNVDPVLIPIFVVLNGVFDPNNTATLGTIGTVGSQMVLPISGSGLIENIPAGTTLSIVATNGSDASTTLSVVGWNISLYRIPCVTSGCCR